MGFAEPVIGPATSGRTRWLYPSYRSNNSEISYRPPRRDGLGGGDDGVGVDAVVAVEVLHRAGLAEMLDAERPHAVAMDGTEPGQSRRMAVGHADDAAMPRQVGEQP